jgi:hypothetical protein
VHLTVVDSICFSATPVLLLRLILQHQQTGMCTVVIHADRILGRHLSFLSFFQTFSFSQANSRYARDVLMANGFLFLNRSKHGHDTLLLVLVIQLLYFRIQLLNLAP